MARETFAIVTGAVPTQIAGTDIFQLSPGYSISGESLRNVTAINIVAAAGTAGSDSIIFSGTYEVGDQVKVTISSNLTASQKYRKTYTVDVSKSIKKSTNTLTNRAIADAFEAKFASEINAGLIDYPIASAVASTVGATGKLLITQKGADKKGLETFVYASSSAGVVASTISQTVYSEGQPADLKEAGIAADEITAATYTTTLVTLNIDVAQPFIDSKGTVVKDLKIFCSAAGYTAALQALINAL